MLIIALAKFLIILFFTIFTTVHHSFLTNFCRIYQKGPFYKGPFYLKNIF
nr:MAG TPA: hypothetical protein [Caudoviricetes sp.]